MKTITKSKSNQPIDAFWMAIALLSAFAVFVSIALHISPLHLISVIEDFATHHFVLVVMIIFFTTMIALRQFYKNRKVKSGLDYNVNKEAASTETNVADKLINKVNNNYSSLKSHFHSFWLSVTLFCGLIIIVALALHTTPSHIIELVEDFATHHFILAALFTFFITLLVLRNYYKSYNANQQFNILRVRSRRKFKGNIVDCFKNRVNQDYQSLKSNIIGVNQIDTLIFEDKDQLVETELRVKREADLNMAMRLGNSFKEKVKIYFKDKDSNRHVYTSVWHVSSTHVTLKYGIVIPVKAIYKVKL